MKKITEKKTEGHNIRNVRERIELISCKKCGQTFGVDSIFIDKVSHTNFRITCPYCSSQNKL